MNKLKTLLEKIRNNKINWKSKKTIASFTVAAAVLFAALTGVTALTVRHINTEPTQKTTLPVAEEVTAAAEADEVSTTTADASNAANTSPASTTTPSQPASATNSKTSAESNNSTGSKNTDTGKTGSSANSGSASHSSGTSSKPATGSNTSSSNSKPSGGSTAKPTTTKPATTQPAKKEFAMTKQEIIDYASNYIESTYHCTYCDAFGKDVPGTGYNAPSTYTTRDSAEEIKECLKGDADATYIQNGWYKVYVEQVDEDTMRVYLFY